MPIDITILRAPAQVNAAPSNFRFSESGGTLGRGVNNIWVLDDPDKYMSSVHAQIALEEGQFKLTDLSTNGTYFNGANDPIGHSNQVVLNENDKFTISDYEFIVTEIITNEHQSTQGQDIFGADPFDNFASSIPIDDDFSFEPAAYQPSHSAMATDPLAISDNLGPVDHLEKDPMVALNQSAEQVTGQVNNQEFGGENFGADGFGTGSFSAQSFTADNEVVSDSIEWPTTHIEHGQIPDDWHLDESVAVQTPSHFATVANSDVMPKVAQAASPVTQQLALSAENQQLKTENQRLQAQVTALKDQLVAAAIATATPMQSSSEADTLINAMGLAHWDLDASRKQEIVETMGILIPEMMDGMMKVLKFRKQIKEEFRINVTTIQSAENNPLKFSANVADAMENMFIKNNSAYKKPVDAVKEGFQGIGEHQIAVIAGMQAAFKGMLERFEPESLELRFEKYKGAGFVSFGKKGKHWTSYKAYHQGLIDNLDDSFQHLFGYDFVQAYEEQMQRLISNRIIKK